MSFPDKVLFCSWVYENEMPAAPSLLESLQEQVLYRAAQTLFIPRLAKGNRTLLKQAGFVESSKKKTFPFSVCCHLDIKSAFSQQSVLPSQN